MTKRAVLDLLRQADTPLSGQKMAQRLKLSRTAVWKAVEALRREGYEILSLPHRGYLLQVAPGKLSAEEIGSHLAEHPWQDRLVVLERVDSTNQFAKQLAASGAPQGTAVLAEGQEKGRGRRGRSFTSPEGMGIYLSVIFRPMDRPERLLHFTASAAQAVAQAVEEITGLSIGVKWVNDLVCGERKLAGILTELSVELESGLADYVVLGVGINCYQRQEDFPPELMELATSIYAQTGHCPDRNALTAAILRHLHRLSETLLTEKAQWMAGYEARCLTLGKQVRVLSAAGDRQALALGLDENGALQVEYTDGTRAWINSGEVSVRGLYGYTK